MVKGVEAEQRKKAHEKVVQERNKEAQSLQNSVEEMKRRKSIAENCIRILLGQKQEACRNTNEANYNNFQIRKIKPINGQATDKNYYFILKKNQDGY